MTFQTKERAMDSGDLEKVSLNLEKRKEEEKKLLYHCYLQLLKYSFSILNLLSRICN